MTRPSSSRHRRSYTCTVDFMHVLPCTPCTHGLQAVEVGQQSSPAGAPPAVYLAKHNLFGLRQVLVVRQHSHNRTTVTMYEDGQEIGHMSLPRAWTNCDGSTVLLADRDPGDFSPLQIGEVSVFPYALDKSSVLQLSEQGLVRFALELYQQPHSVAEPGMLRLVRLSCLSCMTAFVPSCAASFRPSQAAAPTGA